MRGGRRDCHLLCECATTLLAKAEAFPLLFVGSCVRMNLHTCSFLVCGYQEDYRMHLTLRNLTVHNDMKLDTYLMRLDDLKVPQAKAGTTESLTLKIE